MIYISKDFREIRHKYGKAYIHEVIGDSPAALLELPCMEGAVDSSTALGVPCVCITRSRARALATRHSQWLNNINVEWAEQVEFDRIQRKWLAEVGIEPA